MITYKDSGVDIEAGDAAVKKIKELVKQTYNANVVSDLGLFGGMYNLKDLVKEYKDPILVQSIDSVGTKGLIANKVGQYKSLGIDIVAHSCGDIICQGAKPLTFLYYLAYNKIYSNFITEVVAGMSEGCKENDVALIGGEMAELPGVYVPGEFDVVGSITGIVERDKVIDGSKIEPGDIVIGFGSSGLHTNGYSLARKVFFDLAKKSVDDTLDNGEKIGQALLQPHLNYTKPVLAILDKVAVKGIAHITGGGLVGNIPRILPDNCSVELDKSAWPSLPVFEAIQKLGNVPEDDMWRTFNLGIGMTLIIANSQYPITNELLKQFSWLKVYEIGKVIAGNKKVIIK